MFLFGQLKNRRTGRNYDLLSTCAWYTPGVPGLFAVLGWFLVGIILGGLVAMPFLFSGMHMSYVMLIMYPLQFVPLLIYVRLQSLKNSTFDRGYAVDSGHFGKWGGAGLALAVALGALAAGMLLEPVNEYLPDTDGSIIQQLERMMEGPLWVNILTMCIFAPVLEEWMCRGVLLRGLLNYEHKGPEADRKRDRGMGPALAIVISAIFFAAIHGNIWQGISAFAIGCLLGYVYYRTGSLKLTILMHCTNNTLAVLSQKFAPESLKEAKSVLEIMPPWACATTLAVSAVVILVLLDYLRKIEVQSPQGNCDIIPSADDLAGSAPAAGPEAGE